MISNEQRREVAGKLRSLDEHIDGMPSMCTKQEHNAMALRAIRAVVGKGDIFHLLADLIDRPMCKALYYDTEGLPCESYEAIKAQCGNCGHGLEWVEANIYGSSCKLVVANYCHNCGAVVVSDYD